MQQAMGRERRGGGGATEVVENLSAPDVLPTATTVTITNAAKILLLAYFTSPSWSLNKALGNHFFGFYTWENCIRVSSCTVTICTTIAELQKGEVSA
jgi:hypothetical protein